MAPPSSAQPAARRDRPWLLPSNRKVRNLVSISLRNLSPTLPTSARMHGKTIDDDALPNTLKSPAKIVALREHGTLEISRSSSDLRAMAKNAADAPDAASSSSGKSKSSVNGAPRTPPRPSAMRMRRRSTLEWANATPQKRQEKLENVTRERMADVFFSLHVKGIQEPVYISETIERTMNPTFRHIDLSACSPGVARSDRLTLKVWIKTEGVDRWRQLLDISLNLRGLQYLGKSLEKFDYALPQNAVIFQLTDGVYTSFPSLTDYVPPPFVPPARAGNARVSVTPSFDALLRLSKLDDSIQDALATRDKIAADLEDLLEANVGSLAERDKVAEAGDRLKTIEYAKMIVEKQLEKARKQKEETRASLQARRRLMANDLTQRRKEIQQVEKARPEIPSCRNEREVRRKAIQNQRRRICEDLQKCYPIHPIPKRSLAFTIHDLHLPNSDDLDDESPEQVAAALGHTAHVVLLLSAYLQQPLPYPISARSSSSTITDPLSILKTTKQSPKNEKPLRTYPLFSKGVPRFRFEYAIFLLNKDIQLLLESSYGVRAIDIRHTLPNLKYLLYVATAGDGELPARKAGGIRGLLRTKGSDRSPALSRASSNASSDTAFEGRGLAKEGVGMNGKPKGAVESLKKNMGGRGKRDVG